jgi:DNA-binding CsgD family transcriptional regulator
MAIEMIGGNAYRSLASDRLTEDAVSLYTYAVAHPWWTAAEVSSNLGFGPQKLSEAIAVLERFRLFRHSLHPAQARDAVSPDCALAELVADEEVELHRRQSRVDKLRGELTSLGPVYVEARRMGRGFETIEIVRDVRTLRQLLTDWARQVREEVCISHPGGGMTDAGLARSLKRDVDVLHRGVRMRTLLQHSVRHHAPTRHWTSTVVPLGAKIRTVPVVPRRLIMFDREVAFVPLAGGQAESGAALVKEPALIEYLFTVFEMLWTQGRPFVTDHTTENTDEQAEPGDGRDEMSHTILKYLAAGVKDDAIAHRLGLSVRTCRRHIAAIMDHLNASSRFEAGVLSERQGMLGDQFVGSSADSSAVDTVGSG